MFSIRICGLYQPLRGKPLSTEFFKIIRVTSLSVIILAALTFFYREESFSQVCGSLFLYCIVTTLMFTSHLLVRIILAKARALGFNVRHVLIVGTEDLAQSVAEKICLHSEYGFKIIGFLTDQPEKVNSSR